jgi:hypothetical protein
MDLLTTIIYWCDGISSINLFCSGKVVYNNVSKRDLCRAKARRVLYLHDTAHHSWVRKENIANGILLQELLFQGADPNAKGGAPLGIAAENGYIDSMEVLLEAGAFVDIPGERAMLKAIENDQGDAVDTLLEFEVDINGGDGQALVHAASLKNTEMARRLLDWGANPNVARDALGYAAGAGDLDMMRLLIERGADPRAQEDDALCEAASSGHMAAIEYLYGLGNDAVGAARAFTRTFEYGEPAEIEVADYLLEKMHRHVNGQGAIDPYVRTSFHVNLRRYLASSTQTAFCRKWAIRLLDLM